MVKRKDSEFGFEPSEFRNLPNNLGGNVRMQYRK